MLLLLSADPGMDMSAWARTHQHAAQFGLRFGIMHSDMTIGYSMATLTMRNTVESRFAVSLGAGLAQLDEPLADHRLNYCASLLFSYQHESQINAVVEFRHLSNGEGFHQRGSENPGLNQLLFGVGYRF